MHQNRTIYDYSVYLIQADLVRNLPKALLGFSDFSDNPFGPFNEVCEVQRTPYFVGSHTCIVRGVFSFTSELLSLRAWALTTCVL